MAVSSFQKVSKHGVNQIRGTKPSFQNSQLLTSTGVNSLDYYLGGGLPVGTILLVEEEPGGGAYAELLVKYFLAEGVACQHSIFLGGADKSPESILKALPGIIKEENLGEGLEPNDEPMKIAWRYRDLPTSKVSSQSMLNHRFSLGQKMDPSLLKSCNITSQNLLLRDQQVDAHFPVRTSYETLLKHLAGELRSFSTETPPGDLLRIALCGLGSPLCWTPDQDPSLALIRCLHTIKSLLRSAYAICLVTLPANIYSDFGTIQKIRRLSDFVVSCEPFTNSHFNPAFRGYHGLFHVQHKNMINSLAPVGPDTADLVFSAKKKNFLIEKLHLPPDLGNAYDQVYGKSCSSVQGSKIDF